VEWWAVNLDAKVRDTGARQAMCPCKTYLSIQSGPPANPEGPIWKD